MVARASSRTRRQRNRLQRLQRYRPRESSRDSDFNGLISTNQWLNKAPRSTLPRVASRGANNLVGTAGEYYVCAELCRQGFLALLTPVDFSTFCTSNGQGSMGQHGRFGPGAAAIRGGFVWVFGLSAMSATRMHLAPPVSDTGDLQATRPPQPNCGPLKFRCFPESFCSRKPAKPHTPKNNPLFDVVATNPAGETAVSIQVKTRSMHNKQGWKLGGGADPTSTPGAPFVVLVNLHAHAPPDFYVYRYADFASRVGEVFQAYINKPKRTGEARKDPGFRWFDEINFTDADRSRLNNWGPILDALAAPCKPV